MDTGTKISGAMHLALVGWALFGGVFSSEPLPFEFHEASVITAEEYAEALRAYQPPETVAEPAALSVPDVAPETPEVAAEPDTVPDQVQPDAADAPVEDTPPEALAEPAPPETEVIDSTPELVEPDVPAALVRPAETPRPVERIAPQPVEAPPELARPDEVAQPDVSPDEGAEAPQEEQEATAPEEATDRITPETDPDGPLAPTRSMRPQVRPTRRAAEPAATDDAVNAALREALGTPSETPATPAPAGPPLTQGEQDALRVAVQACWNLGSLSTAAMATTVVVGVSMTPEGKPEVPSIRLLSSSGGTAAAAEQAFQAARRAIIRCGGQGYDLPADKYDHWRKIEMTFNPERMRNR